jgi:hypothetical protein
MPDMIRSTIKLFTDLLFARRSKEKIEKTALAIAFQCKSALIRMLTGNSKTLSPGQFPGYVRAYANCSIKGFFQHNNGVRDINPVQVLKIQDLAKELLIEMVVREIKSIPCMVKAGIASAA